MYTMFDFLYMDPLMSLLGTAGVAILFISIATHCEVIKSMRYRNIPIRYSTYFKASANSIIEMLMGDPLAWSFSAKLLFFPVCVILSFLIIVEFAIIYTPIFIVTLPIKLIKTLRR